MLFMGTITINVNDKTEIKFRKATELHFGKTKGSLGKAVTEAIEEWADKKNSGTEAKMLELLEKGFKMGKIKYNSREELHER